MRICRLSLPIQDGEMNVRMDRTQLCRTIVIVVNEADKGNGASAYYRVAPPALQYHLVNYFGNWCALVAPIEYT